MEVAEVMPEQFLSRVGSLPLVASTMGQVTNMYEKTKNYNNLMKYTLQAAETSVIKVAQTAKPIVYRFEKPIGSLNAVACQQLNKLEETYPVISKPTEEVLEQSKVYYEKTIKPCVDGVTGIPSSIKEYSTQKVQNAKTYTYETIDATRKYTLDKVNSAISSPYGEMVTRRVDGLLDSIEPYVDQYLPVEGVQEEKNSIEDHAENNGNGTLMRVVSLSDKVRRRMYTKAMNDMHNVQLRSKETLDNLNFTVDLIHYAKTNIDGVQGQFSAAKSKMNSLWVEINKTEDEVASERTAEGSEANPQSYERRIIATARHLTQKLKTGVQTASHGVTYLPESWQERIENLNKFTEQLYHNFNSASGFKDISEKVLDQSKQQINQARDTLISLGEYLTQLQLLNWVVGASKNKQEIEMETLGTEPANEEKEESVLDQDTSREEDTQ